MHALLLLLLLLLGIVGIQLVAHTLQRSAG
jgi:hypothetical protein